VGRIIGECIIGFTYEGALVVVDCAVSHWSSVVITTSMALRSLALVTLCLCTLASAATRPTATEVTCRSLSANCSYCLEDPQCGWCNVDQVCVPWHVVGAEHWELQPVVLRHLCGTASAFDTIANNRCSVANNRCSTVTNRCSIAQPRRRQCTSARSRTSPASRCSCGS
jgi:hypothetical protein